MKKFFAAVSLVVTCALSLITMPVLTVAEAVDLPYVVIGKDIWLLSRTDGSRLFLLPETYYARVDDLDSEFYFVTFNGVSGKVERNSVSPIGYHTEATGTIQEVRVDSRYNVFTEIKLKSRMDGGAEDLPCPVGATYLYIGDYPTGSEKWYYVRYADIYGYIRAEFTTNPDIKVSKFVPEPRPVEETDEPIVEEPTNDNGNLIKILVITGLGVALVVLLILIFRPKKRGVNRYYYEDNVE